jgi:hypothetical protein
MATYDVYAQQATVLGTVGDLQGWSFQTAVDNDLNRYYVVGEDSNQDRQLWVMDSLTGALIDTVPLGSENPQAMVLGPGGHLLYITWNGTAEELKSLDPVTGQATVLGVVGDLMWIQSGGVLVYDEAANAVYVWGATGSSDDDMGSGGGAAVVEDRLWVMDATTGAVLLDLPQESHVVEAHLVYGVASTPLGVVDPLADVEVTISPDGGLWLAGTTVSVQWDLAVVGATVDIDLVDAAGLVVASAAMVPNTGSFDWMLPLDVQLGDGHQVRVTDSLNPAKAGLSSAVTVGTVVAFRWNDAESEQEMVRISPETGDMTVHGIVGDLAWWSPTSRMVSVQPDGDYVFVPGTAAGDPSMDDGASYVYVMDKWTGALIGQQPNSESLSGAEINSAGDMLFCRWNGTEEELVIYEPFSQTATVIGTVGTLEWWSNQTAIDNDLDRFYAAGTDAVGDTQLWVLDSLTGGLIDTVPLGTETLEAMTLGPNGHLLYIAWNGTEELLKSLNPDTGQVTLLGIVGDLAWVHNGGELVYNPWNDAAYIWGSTSAGDVRLWVIDATSGSLLLDLPQDTIASEAHLIH